MCLTTKGYHRDLSGNKLVFLLFVAAGPRIYTCDKAVRLHTHRYAHETGDSQNRPPTVTVLAATTRDLTSKRK